MSDIMAGMDEKDRECLLIYKPLVYDSHLFGVCLAEMSSQAYGFFWEMISGIVSVCFFSVRQWLHVRRLSTAAFGRISYFP